MAHRHHQPARPFLALAAAGALVLAPVGAAVGAPGKPGSPRYTEGAAGAGDPYFPLAGNGGIDVEHYSLDLHYQPPAAAPASLEGELDATATITLTATQDLRSFNLDLRGLTKETGVSVDDVAKRLIDYGFHAPTMSFPVAGTLMVEPTESEDRGELDRFVDAMISIRAEMDEAKKSGVEGSVLRNAPHTALSLARGWDERYDRMTAAYPEGVDPSRKYWSPVRRIDGVYGDRNLVTAWPSTEADAE